MNNKGQNKNQWIWGVVIVFIVLLVLVMVLAWRLSEIKREPIPTPLSYKSTAELSGSEKALETTAVTGLAKALDNAGEINLAVPFQPQAPKANWDQPYQDACEEAAVIMVERYLAGKQLTPGQMDEGLLKMVAWEDEVFGFSKDTNIAEVKRLVNNYYPALSAEAKYDITVEDIKQELLQGKPVIVLANGRIIANPYYTQPGPDKHALVIKGFVGDKFITNDPGTRRGADYTYSTKKVYEAIVDYDGGTAGTGKKAMIVISPN